MTPHEPQPEGPPAVLHHTPQPPCFGAEPLPPTVATILWRGDQLGTPVAEVLSSGYPELDRALPGGGWPCGALTELLVSQFSIVEARLLLPAVAPLTQTGRTVVLVGPALPPHAAGLRHGQVDERHLVWIDVDTPRDRLWATEQLIKAGTCGAIVSWLPLVRAEQIRRLQVLAARCRGPVFLCRPDHAARDASAAALRVRISLAPDWQLNVEVLKRMGPPLERPVRLVSIPGGLDKIMTPRLRHPSRWAPQIHRERHDHAVDSTAAALRRRSPEPSRS